MRTPPSTALAFRPPDAKGDKWTDDAIAATGPAIAGAAVSAMPPVAATTEGSFALPSAGDSCFPARTLGKLARNNPGHQKREQCNPIAAVADREGHHRRQEKEVKGKRRQDRQENRVPQAPVRGHQKDADQKRQSNCGLINMQPPKVDGYNDSGGSRRHTVANNTA